MEDWRTARPIGNNSNTTPNHSELRSSHPFYGDLLSWTVIGWLVAVLLGVWGVLLSIGSFGLSNAVFAIGELLALGRLTADLRGKPRLFANYVFVLLGALVAVAFYVGILHLSAKMKDDAARIQAQNVAQSIALKKIASCLSVNPEPNACATSILIQLLSTSSLGAPKIEFPTHNYLFSRHSTPAVTPQIEDAGNANYLVREQLLSVKARSLAAKLGQDYNSEVKRLKDIQNAHADEMEEAMVHDGMNRQSAHSATHVPGTGALFIQQQIQREAARTALAANGGDLQEVIELGGLQSSNQQKDDDLNRMKQHLDVGCGGGENVALTCATSLTQLANTIDEEIISSSSPKP